MIRVLYEHRSWTEPLFSELERRSVAHQRLHVSEIAPETVGPSDLIVNRVGAGVGGEDPLDLLQRTLNWLRTCEEHGARILNGAAAFEYTISKLRQYQALCELGLEVPPYTEFRPGQDPRAAARGLRLPLIFKPNVGGSGAGMRRLSAPSELDDLNHADPGPDGRAVLQEELAADDDCIVRVELLDGELLYALRIPVVKGCFDNCPVDLGARAAVHEPEPDALAEARRILERCATRAGSVEYLVHAGRRQYFDINPFSNFVSNPVELLGFDPTARFVDALLA